VADYVGLYKRETIDRGHTLFLPTFTAAQTPRRHGEGADDVFGQRFASDGTPVGPEFRINTFLPSQQKSTAVAVDP
jgi:hypothetical protein